MNGFYDVVRDLLVSLDPHVRIVAEAGSGLQHVEANEIVDQSLQLPQVISAEPYVEGKALLVPTSRTEVNRVVIVRGTMGNTVRDGIVIGEFDTAERGLIMGLSLGQRLGLSPGPEISRVTLFLRKDWD